MEQMNILISEKHKKWVLSAAKAEGLSIAQWVRIQAVRRIWNSLNDLALSTAVSQAAIEVGVSVREAMKLNNPDEALSLVPPEKLKEFKKHVETIFPEHLKREMKEADFSGLAEELNEIYSDSSISEWEAAQETPCKWLNYSYKNGQLIPLKDDLTPLV
jgi:hypothetical protein